MAARHTEDISRIEQAFESARDKKVLFVGENIEDEYVYVEPLYKPSKETILAVREVSSQKFVGGIAAAAEHVRGWCEAFIVSQWSPVRKKRYVQEGFNRKLFEIYANHVVGTPPRPERLDEVVKAADLVIVIDFGHGFITDETREVLYGAKFLAVNAQTNAGNHGFNPVTKYKRADYVCVDYQEARLAVGDQWGDLWVVLEKLCERMGTEKVIVTQGRQGARWLNGMWPALEGHPMDTMGAGDCFLAYTAPLIASGLELPDAAFVGCVAAALKTEIVGHERSVKPDQVMQRVRDELSRRDHRAIA